MMIFRHLAATVWVLLACERPSTQPLADAENPRDTQNVPSTTQAQVTLNYDAELGRLDPLLFGTQGLHVNASDVRVKDAGFRVLATHAPTYVSAEPLGYAEAALFRMDRDISEFVKLGAEPWLYFYQITKPDDARRYFASVQAIAQHIKDTFPTVRPIFFLGNEPDWEVVQCAGAIRPSFDNVFWNGTRQEFFSMYEEFARAIKDVEANYIVGGVGLGTPVLEPLPADAPQQARNCVPDETFSGRRGEVSKWVTDFLDYCKDNDVPLDYLSFHAYSPAPYRRFYENAEKLVRTLAAYPRLSPLYGQAKLATNEWSMQLTDDVGIRALCLRGASWDEACVGRLESMKTAYKSAHHVVGLIGMIDAGLDLNVSYSAISQDVPDRGTDAAKTDPDSNCRFFTLVCSDNARNAYYGFRGFNWLSGTTRLETTGSDYLNFAAIAGKASDGSVIVALGNHDVVGYMNDYPEAHSKAGEEAELAYFEAKRGAPRTYDSFRVTLDGFPGSSSNEVVVEQYAVDDINLLTLVRRQTLRGETILVIDGEMARPSVQFLKISQK